MNINSKNLVVTALVAVFCFLSTAYIACKKTADTPSPDACSNVVCQNGGSCFKGTCSCLPGFEGANCEIKAISRYAGTWNVSEKIVQSDDLSRVGNIKNYTMVVTESDRIYFLIQDFTGDTAFDNVKCRIGVKVIKDTTYADAYTHFVFTKGQVINGTTIQHGDGDINDGGSFLSGRYLRIFPGATAYVSDSVSFTANKVQ